MFFFRQIHCLIINDLVVFFKKVEEGLQCFSTLLKKLKPRFTLMGSVAEGTRLSIANEMDICMEFEGLKRSPFKINLEDPYHIYKTDTFPDWMQDYFDSNGRLVLQKFKLQLLEAVDSVAGEVLNDNPTRLQAYTPNKKYDWKKCKDCGENANLPLFKQCKNCCVVTAQTKVGICLQLAWKHEGFSYKKRKKIKHQSGFTLYTLVDLVPMFNIEPTHIRPFVKATNKAMLEKDHPEEWYEYLKKYLSTDKILQGLGTEDEYVSRVLLKLMNSQKENNYMVKAGQHLSCEKFQTERLKEVFCLIKVVKQSLGVDTINNYLLKKILAMPEYLQLDQEKEDDDELLYKVLSSSHLKHHFDKSIDFDKYVKHSRIMLRK